jgi:hypothetical protein
MGSFEISQESNARYKLFFLGKELVEKVTSVQMLLDQSKRIRE